MIPSFLLFHPLSSHSGVVTGRNKKGTHISAVCFTYSNKLSNHIHDAPAGSPHICMQLQLCGEGSLVLSRLYKRVGTSVCKGEVKGWARSTHL